MTEQVVGSQAPSLASDALKEDKRGYGQNGYGGASSDTPSQRTTTGFQASKPDSLSQAQADRKRIQERVVSDQTYPLSHGMDKRSPRNR